MSTSSSNERFDELRAAHPDVAFNLYAMTPGGVVTFEAILPDGKSFTWSALTAADAMALAFPPVSVPLKIDWPEAAQVEPPKSAASIFD